MARRCFRRHPEIPTLPYCLLLAASFQLNAAAVWTLKAAASLATGALAELPAAEARSMKSEAWPRRGGSSPPPSF